MPVRRGMGMNTRVPLKIRRPSSDTESSSTYSYSSHGTYSQLYWIDRIPWQSLPQTPQAPGHTWFSSPLRRLFLALIPWHDKPAEQFLSIPCLPQQSPPRAPQEGCFFRLTTWTSSRLSNDKVQAHRGPGPAPFWPPHCPPHFSQTPPVSTVSALSLSKPQRSALRGWYSAAPDHWHQPRPNMPPSNWRHWPFRGPSLSATFSLKACNILRSVRTIAHSLAPSRNHYLASTTRGLSAYGKRS